MLQQQQQRSVPSASLTIKASTGSTITAGDHRPNRRALYFRLVNFSKIVLRRSEFHQINDIQKQGLHGTSFITAFRNRATGGRGCGIYDYWITSCRMKHNYYWFRRALHFVSLLEKCAAILFQPRNKFDRHFCPFKK